MPSREGRPRPAVMQTRSRSTTAVYELDLSTDNRELVGQAQRAIDRAASIQNPQPDSKEEMDRRAVQVREDLAQLIAIARTGKLADPSEIITSSMSGMALQVSYITYPTSPIEHAPCRRTLETCYGRPGLKATALI